MTATELRDCATEIEDMAGKLRKLAGKLAKAAAIARGGSHRFVIDEADGIMRCACAACAAPAACVS